MPGLRGRPGQRGKSAGREEAKRGESSPTGWAAVIASKGEDLWREQPNVGWGHFQLVNAGKETNGASLTPWLLLGAVEKGPGVPSAPDAVALV